MFLHSDFLPVNKYALIVNELPICRVLTICVHAAAGFRVFKLLLYCGNSWLTKLALEAAIECAVNTHHFSKTASFQVADLVDLGQIVDRELEQLVFLVRVAKSIQELEHSFT